MAVTIDTIPAQAGEIVRALMTINDGGDPGSTAHINWYNHRGSNTLGSVSDDSDMEIDTTLGEIARLQYRSNYVLRMFADTNGFTAALAAGGSLDGKTLLIAGDDSDPAIDMDIGFDDLESTSNNIRADFAPDAAAQAVFNALADGGLINLVISDPGAAPSQAEFDASSGDPTVDLAPETTTPPNASFAARSGSPTVSIDPFRAVSFQARAGNPTVAIAPNGGALLASFEAESGSPSVAVVPEFDYTAEAEFSAESGEPAVTIVLPAYTGLSAESGEPTVDITVIAVEPALASFIVRAGTPAVFIDGFRTASFAAAAGSPTVNFIPESVKQRNPTAEAGAHQVDRVRTSVRAAAVRPKTSADAVRLKTTA